MWALVLGENSYESWTNEININITEKIKVETLLMLSYYNKLLLLRLSTKDLNMRFLDELSHKINNDKAFNWINRYWLIFNNIWESWERDLNKIKRKLYTQD